jgi:hypothetical protein
MFDETEEMNAPGLAMAIPARASLFVKSLFVWQFVETIRP